MIKTPKPYWVEPLRHHPCHDYTKEVVKPGVNETFPEGGVGLRVDGDFWIVAVIPYVYRFETTEQLVNQLWEDLTVYTIMPDHKEESDAESTTPSK